MPPQNFKNWNLKCEGLNTNQYKSIHIHTDTCMILQIEIYTKGKRKWEILITPSDALYIAQRKEERHPGSHSSLAMQKPYDQRSVSTPICIYRKHQNFIIFVIALLIPLVHSQFPKILDWLNLVSQNNQCTQILVVYPQFPATNQQYQLLNNSGVTPYQATFIHSWSLKWKAVLSVNIIWWERGRHRLFIAISELSITVDSQSCLKAVSVII